MAEENKNVPSEIEKPSPGWMWIRDSQGNPSASLTFVTIAFWVTTLSFLLSMIQKIGPVELRAFDATACSVYTVPLLTLYFGRKFTDAKYGAKSDQE